jgi:hypothetical protein
MHMLVVDYIKLKKSYFAFLSVGCIVTMAE